MHGRHKAGHDDNPQRCTSILAPMRLRLWDSAKRQALGTHQYGIAKAPPMLGVPGGNATGGFQGRALNSPASPPRLLLGYHSTVTKFGSGSSSSPL